MEHVTKIIAIQGDHTIRLMKAGIPEEQAREYAGDIIQEILDSNLLSPQAESQIKNFLGS